MFSPLNLKTNIRVFWVNCNRETMKNQYFTIQYDLLPDIETNTAKRACPRLNIKTQVPYTIVDKSARALCGD